MKTLFNTFYLKALFLLTCIGFTSLTLQAQDIDVNQTGFLPIGTKLAQVPNGSGTFQVVDVNTNASVFTGTLSASSNWEPAQESFATADFSAFETPGTYRIVAGSNTSYPFTIGESVYDDVAAAALKFYYYQRSSSDVTPQHGGQWARGFGHPDTNVRVHSSAAGGRAEGSTFSAPKGWYDAGDYGKYVVNSGISTWTLMALYELYPEFANEFDGNIPESGNGVPDLLNEVRWNLDWLIKMQDPVDGGVYHKMTSLGFEGQVMPDNAHLQRYAIGKGTAATFDFAAVMAQAARVYQPFDPIFAQECLTAAERAWNWGINNDNIFFNNPGDVQTGEYGQNWDNQFVFSRLKDEKAWAAIELYITTGNDSYWNASELLTAEENAMRIPGWPDVAPLGYLSLIANKNNVTGAADMAEVENRVVGYANWRKSQFMTSAYRVVDIYFDWGSNANFLNDGMIALYAYDLTGDEEQLSVAQSGLDYVLGKNPVGTSYVTGFGSKSPMNPHHRPSVADGIQAPVPGMVLGGAQNGTIPGGETCFHPNSNIPAKRFLDDWCSFSTAEVTINWNAPMVFLTWGIMNVTNQPCEDNAVVDVQISGEDLITVEIGDVVNLSARALNICGGVERDAVLTWSANAPGGVFSNTNSVKTEIVTVTANGITDQVEINVVPENASLIANAENNGVTLFGTEWFALDDNGNGGASTITPNTTPLPVTSGGANGTANSIEVSYSLDEGTLTFNPFVGFGFPITEDETGNQDFEGTTGISFWHKGDAMIVKVPMTTVTDFNYYSSPVPAHTEWTEVKVSWNQFSQAAWGDPVSFDETEISSIQFEVQGPTGTAGTVAVDEVKLEGVILCENTSTVDGISISEGDQTVTIGKSFNFSAVVTNECGNPISNETVTWSSNAPNGVFTATEVGTEVVSATVGSFSSSVTVTVRENLAPDVNAGADVTTSQAVGSAQLTGSATDPDNDPLTFNWIQVDGPSTATILDPTSAVTLIGDLVVGTYVFELSATDGFNSPATDQVTVEVNNVVNMLTNGDFSGGFAPWVTYVNENATANHDVSANELQATISNGGSETWHVQYYQGGLSIENGEEYRLTFDARSASNRSIVVSVEKNGEPWTGFFSEQSNLTSQTQSFSYDFTMEAATESNGRVAFNVGNSSSDVFIDNVVLEKLPKGNKAPVANAGSDQILVNGTPSTTLDGSASSDSDNGPVALTYSWTQTAGPTVTIDDATAVQPTISGLQNNTSYEFSLTVSDGLASSTATVTVSLQEQAQEFTTRVEAEDFDNMSGIQIEDTEDVDGNSNIGWVDNGDFMEYNGVNVPAPGEGELRFRVAADGFDNKSFTVSANGNLLANVNFQATGGWQNWTTVKVDVDLPFGENTIRIEATSDGFNMNWFEISNEEVIIIEEPCETWQANTNYPVGTVVSFNGNNYTSTNEWNGTAGTPDTAIWGWSAGGSCSSNGRQATLEAAIEVQEAINLFPNPAQNDIYLSGLGQETYQVGIYSITGELEQFLTVDGTQGNVKLEVGKLNAGLYIIQVSGANVAKSLRFMKK